MTSRLSVVAVAALVLGIGAANCTMAAEPATTTYGERNPQAPAELDLFSFLVGTWNVTGKTRQEDGKYVDWDGATWIGRYVLDGMAIADELHASTPDGKPGLGITLRQFDAKRGSWIIEFLNVTYSFLRRQVNPRSGSVSRDGETIVVISEDAETRIRENYRVLDRNHVTYTTELSRDAGRTWGPILVEMTMTRVD